MEIVRLERTRLSEASAVLARAFHNDPAWVWLFPDEERRARVLPWLFRISFDVTTADVFTTAGDVAGASRWLRPGQPPMHVVATLRALVLTPLRLRETTTQFLAFGRAVENMRIDVAPSAHWYLAGIGVDPAAQRQGVGGALLRPGLDAATRDALPAVLLTHNEANLSFYESHGFRIVREGPTPQGGPHAWAMVRRP